MNGKKMFLSNLAQSDTILLLCLECQTSALDMRLFLEKYLIVFSIVVCNRMLLAVKITSSIYLTSK